jgi:hypothetical protein
VKKISEKHLWQAIEKSNIAYTDWIAYKTPGEPTVQLLIETEDQIKGYESEIESKILLHLNNILGNTTNRTYTVEDWRNVQNINIKLTSLKKGTFAKYLAYRQAEGADLAHLKPPHINPPDTVLATFLNEVEEPIILNKTSTQTPKKSTIKEVTAK